MRLAASKRGTWLGLFTDPTESCAAEKDLHARYAFLEDQYFQTHVEKRDEENRPYGLVSSYGLVPSLQVGPGPASLISFITTTVITTTEAE